MLRSYVSAPNLSFGMFIGDAEVIDYQPERKSETIKRHTLQDLTNIKEHELISGQSREVIQNTIENPFSKSTKTEFSKVRLISIVSRSFWVLCTKVILLKLILCLALTSIGLPIIFSIL